MTALKATSSQDSVIENPFKDPSINEVIENANSQVYVETYNPFQHLNEEAIIQPAVMQITLEPQTSKTKNIPTVNELERRQRELERREEELARLENEIHQRTYEQNVRQKNWPPLPKNCCWQPCFYQNIEIDIPIDFQKIVRQLYNLWAFHGIVMIINVIGGIIIGDFKIILMGIVYVILFTPLSYVCWFRPAYKAFRSDSSFNFMLFFCMFFFQFIVSISQTIGLPNSGNIGLITALNKFKLSYTGSDVLASIMELIIACGFGCAAIADLLLLTKIHRTYRSSGASFAKAQNEFTSEFFKNQQVRSTATNLVATAMKSERNPDLSH